MHVSPTGRRAAIRSERGQVVVFFALMIPVIFAFGSIVMSVGNWYVLKRHLQTQADAAALAGAAWATSGCAGDAQQKITAQGNMKLEALNYAGDTAQGLSAGAPGPVVPSGAPYNRQPEDVGDVRMVFNSTQYWDPSNPSLDGTGYDWTAGNPCDTKKFEVKATDVNAPLLWRWIPLFPSLKARALVEFEKVPQTNGLLPIGVPEFDPTHVAALFVDEGVSGPTNPASIGGAGFLSPVAQAGLPPGSPLAGLNAWQETVGSGITRPAPGGFTGNAINLNNTSNHSVVIVASRDPNMCISAGGPCGNGSLQAICSQNPSQTHCYGGGGLNDGISFIHIYSGSGGGVNPPAIRDATLSGGCATDDSRPYYNLDGVDVNGNGCTVTLTAHVDFGNGGADPTPFPICAQLSIAGGSAMTYAGGDVWTGTYTFPNTPVGRYLMDINWSTDQGGANCGGQQNNGTLQDVQGAYVSDPNHSDPIEYLTLANMTPGLPTTDGNSYPKTPNAQVQVTVAFVPPLKDTPISDPPIKLRFGTGPSQTQALDCNGSGTGQNGWRALMVSGCPGFQINQRNGSCATPYPVPADCIDSENGNFNNKGVQDRFASPCTPNYWDGVNYPPPTLPGGGSDPRWIPLFILDEVAFTVSGKRTYPIRRFGGFYVTAGDGMNCPGDDPASGVKRTELWGHFVTYVPNNFGESIPGGACPFINADLCIPFLAE